MSTFNSNPYPEPYPPYDPYQPLYQPDNSRTLVKLAVIFNYISAGLDLLGALFLVGAAFFINWLSQQPVPPGSTEEPPPAFLWILYVAMAVFSLAAAVVKFIACDKMRKHSDKAWAWAMAAGIVGCVQFVCGGMCMLPTAAGIYTIVVLCFQRVKDFLAQPVSSVPPSAPPGQ